MFENAKVGDGATYCMYSDNFAATIVEVNTKGTRIVVQFDKCKLLNGVDSGEPDALKFYPGGFCGHTSGVQRWQCEPDPEGIKKAFTKRKNGKWKAIGADMYQRGETLIEGRHHHFDFNF